MPEIHPESELRASSMAGNLQGAVLGSRHGGHCRGVRKGEKCPWGPPRCAQLGFQGAEESDTVCSLGELTPCWGRGARTQGERNVTS